MQRRSGPAPGGGPGPYVEDTSVLTNERKAAVIDSFKTHASDTEKIATIVDLVGGALDVDALLDRL